jgi:hypothetical protein
VPLRHVVDHHDALDRRRHGRRFRRACSIRRRCIWLGAKWYEFLCNVSLISGPGSWDESNVTGAPPEVLLVLRSSRNF